MRPLGEVLAEDGDLTIRRLRRASDWQKKNGGSIEAALLATGALTEEVLTDALSRATGLPGVSRKQLLEAEAAVVDSLPADARRRLHAMPFDWCGVRLKVAVSDPTNTVLETGLVAATGYDVELYVAPDPVLEACLAVWEAKTSGVPVPPPEAAPAAAEAPDPVARLGRALLVEAVNHEALALELAGDAISAYAKTLHFKVPPMTRRFDPRLLPPLLDWFFARAGLEGSFEILGRDGEAVTNVLVEKTPGGLTLHFRDAEAPVAARGGCNHLASATDVFCPACGAAM